MPELISSSTTLLLWAAFGYLAGSIPFGVLVARAFGLGNLREIGSGNIGATNVLRTGSKPAAVLTVFLDGGKGAAAVLLARSLAAEDAAQLAGLMAFLGHCFPIWLGFRGGKGMATFLGLVLALTWPVDIAACLTWLVMALWRRISSLATLVAAAASIAWMPLLGYAQGMLLAVVLAQIIFLRHRDNIKRLRAGTEPRIGAR